MESVIIGGVEYVPKGSESKAQATKKAGLEYVIVRTYSAGVFAGYLKSRKEKEVELIEARRLWYWDGAASLSQMAVDGTSKPQNCKFPVAVSKITLTEAIEILPCTEKSRKSIEGVKAWSV